LAYGARLESVLGATPREFESRILRHVDRREAFANDPLNLLAVNGPLNEQKGDGDAATWLPPNKAFRCACVARQVAVKARYAAWVTPAEESAIATVLGACPGEPAPGAAPVAGQPEPAPVPAPTAAQLPEVAAPTSSAHYASCAAARAAGVAPIPVGQPGYSRALDRDGDGIACE
jgi:predicted component of type VI protein secretion system